MQGQERDKNQLSWVPVSQWKKLSGKGGQRMKESGEEQVRAPAKWGERSPDEAKKGENQERKLTLTSAPPELLGDVNPAHSLECGGAAERCGPMHP